MPKKPKCWTFAAGKKGARVTVYERTPGGPIYARVRDPVTARYRRISLHHTSRTLAETYALEQAAKLRGGRLELLAGRPTLERVFGTYLAHKTPMKSPEERKSDERRAELWQRFLGARKDPSAITREEWDRFVRQRRDGVLDARGRPVPEDDRAHVRVRTVEHDCLWLRDVLRWATKWTDTSGRRLLRENPVAEFKPPKEPNPRRPVASTSRYRAIRSVSDDVGMELRWAPGDRRRQRSYLSELLDLAYWTGRRIAAVRKLTFHDLRLTVGPHGSICWPAATDKGRRDLTAPLAPEARAAIDRVIKERPGIGATPLFPSPTDPMRPVSKERVRTWLLEAEERAGVPKQDGSLWHAYRRGWATARKHMPVKDTAEAGGWRSVVTLLRHYQQADDDTMLAVVTGAREVREREAV